MAQSPKAKPLNQPAVKKGMAQQQSAAAHVLTDWKTWVAVFASVILTYVLYQGALDNDFTNWDDDVYVTEQPIIRNLKNTDAILKTPVGGNHHPVTMWTLAWDYSHALKKGSTEPSPRPFHVTNVILHVVNTALVFFVIWYLTGGRFWLSAISSLFFGIHPMHVESVAWIAERKDVLYTMFFLLAMLAYTHYVKRKNLLFLALTLGLFILSVFSKPAAVVFPFVLIGMDFFLGRFNENGSPLRTPGDFMRHLVSQFSNSRFWIALAEKIPFIAVSVIAGLLTLVAQKASGAVDDPNRWTLFQKFLFASYGSVMYLVKLFWPANLCHLYPYPNVEGKDLDLIFYLSPLLFILIFGTAVWLGRKQPVVWFGLFFFFLNLVLVLQFFTVGQAIIADRYTYVPYIGIFLILGWWLDEKQDAKKSWLMPVKIISASSLVVIGALSLWKTPERTEVWKDTVTLWTDAINKFPNRIIVAYNNRGHHYRSKKMYNEALSDYRKAIALNSTYHLAWANKGNIFFDMNQNDSALANYSQALRINPNLWETLANRGAVYARINRYEEALSDFDKAIKLNSGHENAWRNRAITYSMVNRHEESIADYRQVLKLRPNDPDIMNAIGVGYQYLKKYPESITEFSNAIALKPSFGMFYLNRSYSYNAMGDKANALKDAQASLRNGYQVPPQYLQSLGAN